MTTIDDDRVTILNAIMTNTRIKVWFGGLDPDDAEFAMRATTTGYIDLQTFKPKSARPTATGNVKVTLANHSRAEHRARATSAGQADIRSVARASASINAAMSASGSVFGSGELMSFASLPPDTLLEPATLVGKNHGHSRSNSSSNSRALSRANSTARQYARGRALTAAQATTDGASTSEGTSEAMVTVYENLPTEFYSLEEMQHRIIGLLMNLPNRVCIVKIRGQAPFKTRTTDLTPAFKDAEAKAVLMPLFLAHIQRQSPYLVPIEQVDAEIAARLIAIANPEHEADTDFSAPGPVSILDVSSERKIC